MTNHAIELLNFGRLVVIVGSTKQYAMVLVEEIRSKLDQRIHVNVRATSIEDKEVVIEIALVKGCPEEVVLVDHFAWEELVGRLHAMNSDLRRKLKQIKDIIEQ